MIGINPVDPVGVSLKQSRHQIQTDIQQYPGYTRVESPVVGSINKEEAVMATLIGVVKQAVGEVFAVAGDGSRRPLTEGDRVFSGEQLVTGAGGAVALELANGQVLTLGRDSVLSLDASLLANAAEVAAEVAEEASAATQPAPVAPTPGDQQEADDLIAAIEAGADPTVDAEATAAGGAGGAGGVGGAHQFVLLDATAADVDPEVGYPTGPITSGPEFLGIESVIGADEVDSSPVVDVNYRPVVGAGPGEVDEAALSDAQNPGPDNPGSNPDSPAESTYGNLVITSPDGVSSILVQGADGIWVDVQGGGVVEGIYGTLVFDADNNWVYTLNGNTLDNANPGSDESVSESFPVRVVDGDGDVSPTVSIDVVVLDDDPSVVPGEGEFSSLIVDETGDGLGQTATGNFAGNFTPTFGADGGTIAYSLEINTLESGLVDVATGDPIELHLVDGVIEGWVNNDPDMVAFTLEVNASGDVSLTQLRAIQHPDPDSDDEPVFVAGGVIRLVATVSDGDGDVASDGLDLGGFLVFRDDGPSVSVGEVDASAITLTTQDAQTIGAEVSDSDSASFAAAMLAAVTPTYGADGAGSTVLSGYTLTIDQAVTDLTSDGKAISLSMDGNDVVGSTEDGAVFRISVDETGEVTLTQYAELDHLPESLDTSNDNANIPLPDDLVSLSATATVTDGDNDQVTTTVSLDLGGNL
ncbi:retention module-containing protein, partial [Pseudomonas sp. N040]|uniref:retention module-containing protein n=1 Tax=Pseudomonas sp. N040 TaxID=2785325 RepID=UPI0018A303CA